MKLIKVTRCCDQDGYTDCPYATASDKGKYYCDHPEIDMLSLEALEDAIPEGCPLEDGEQPRPDFMAQALNEGDGAYRP